MTLQNRIAIITGSTAGIGLAIAQDLTAQGAKAVLNGRRAEKLKQVAATFKPGATTTVAGDAADQSTIDHLFTAAETLGAPADLVVVNAGRGLNGSVVSSDPAEWEEMIRTNLTGAARLLRTAAHHMLGGGMSGSPSRTPDSGPLPDWQTKPRDIVVIGSVVGRHVSPFSSMYGSTKFGVHGLAEGLRRELAPKGIRVTLIEPGFVVSEFQGVAGYKDDWFKGVVDRIGPVLEPADVARAVTFACSQPARVHIGDILIRPTRQDYP